MFEHFISLQNQWSIYNQLDQFLVVEINILLHVRPQAIGTEMTSLVSFAKC